MFQRYSKVACVAASLVGVALLGGCYTDGSNRRVVVANAALEDYDVEAAIAGLDAKADDRIAWLRSLTEILVWTDMTYDLQTFAATPAAGQAVRMVNGENNAFAYVNQLDQQSGFPTGLMERMLQDLVTRTCPELSDCPTSVIDVIYGRRQIATAEFDEYVRRARCTFGAGYACAATTSPLQPVGSDNESGDGGHAM